MRSRGREQYAFIVTGQQDDVDYVVRAVKEELKRIESEVLSIEDLANQMTPFKQAVRDFNYDEYFNDPAGARPYSLQLDADAAKLTWWRYAVEDKAEIKAEKKRVLALIDDYRIVTCTKEFDVLNEGHRAEIIQRDNEFRNIVQHLYSSQLNQFNVERSRLEIKVTVLKKYAETFDKELEKFYESTLERVTEPVTGVRMDSLVENFVSFGQNKYITLVPKEHIQWVVSLGKGRAAQTEGD